MPRDPKCPLGKDGMVIVALDIKDGSGHCVCMLPKEANPEEVGLCWFKNGKCVSMEQLTAAEAALVGGHLVYGATLFVGGYGPKEKPKQ